MTNQYKNQNKKQKQIKSKPLKTIKKPFPNLKKQFKHI